MTHKKIIYIADDDHAIVDAIKLVLEHQGFEVGFSYDGGVVKKILNKAPDLLLLDIWMSGIDGRDICKTLKTDKKTESIPIVMVSAHPEAEKISKECGANDYISKPFSISDLLHKISHYIKNGGEPRVSLVG